MKVAIAGDAILTRPISQISHPRATAIFDLLRSADVAFLNCETTLHDYRGKGVFPIFETGMVAMRSPVAVADELMWLNARLVATANNHALDYSYGGLESTHRALKVAGITRAGTGPSLAEARAAAYLECPTARVALVSMSTSATRESRASDPFDGVQARPGLNPLGWHYAVGRESIDTVIEMAKKHGLWVARIADNLWETCLPGLHNSFTRYHVTDEPGIRMVLDARDVAGNLRSIRNARANSDILIAHIHNHEWDIASGSLRTPPSFVEEFARQAIDAGADAVVAQGSHAPIRGIELYQGKPIFYDPGDFFLMTGDITRYPREFYERHSEGVSVPFDEALPIDGNAALHSYSSPVTPKGGYFGDWEPCGAVVVLDYDAGRLRGVELHPFTRDFCLVDKPVFRSALAGLPLKPDVDHADQILAKFAELSRPYATVIEIEDGVGRIVLGN